MNSLAGKVAVVTGGGQGIGRAESLLLAAEGAAVVVNDRGGLKEGKPTSESTANKVVEEIRAKGGKAVANFADVADWKAAEEMIQQAYDEFGRLDILLCNAGIVRDRMAHNLSEQDWDDVVRVHLKGHFAPTRHAITRWRKKFKSDNQPINGRVIYTASEAGMFGHLGQPNYSAAKAGILGLCFEIAKEVGRMGVTVNTISPRGRTPMTEGAFGQIKEIIGFDSWAPENVAPWAAFLSRDEAAEITGQIFVVYGGTVQVMEPWRIASKISEERTWTSDELVLEARKLFPDMIAEPPEFPDIGLPS